MSKPQLFEVAFHRGQMRVILDPPGSEVSGASGVGSVAGDTFVADAVKAAITTTVNRASELLPLIDAANRTVAVQTERLSALEREKKAATGSLFGPALDAKLRELEAEADAAREREFAAGRERERTQGELIRLRDDVLNSAPEAVKGAVADRLRAAKLERQKLADLLAAVVAQRLVAVLRLDAELEVLEELKVMSAVKLALEQELAPVFGLDGIAPHTVSDPRADREPPEPVEQNGWRRRGYEHEYGVDEDDWEER
jgi:hypothetical protein